MYAVLKSAYDASRPYAVIATFRTFNRVIERYADRAAAVRRAGDMNRAAKRFARAAAVRTEDDRFALREA